MPRKVDPTYTYSDSFPTKLSDLMRERKVSQDTLGKAIGVRRQTISLYMNGSSKPDIIHLTKIAKYFNVSSDWLLGLHEHLTTDIEIRDICEMTGLSEIVVNNLIKLKNTSTGAIETEDKQLPDDVVSAHNQMWFINILLSEMRYFKPLAMYAEYYVQAKRHKSLQMVTMSEMGLDALVENDSNSNWGKFERMQKGISIPLAETISIMCQKVYMQAIENITESLGIVNEKYDFDDDENYDYVPDDEELESAEDDEVWEQYEKKK